MKQLSHWAAVLLLLSTLLYQPSTACAQGTAFTFQGQLQNNGSPASGSYAMVFALYNTNATGVAIAGPVTNNSVSVTNGLFTTTIDFGAGVFLGATNWLQIGVATNGVSTFTPLSPRQQLTPTPYAIYSANAGNAVTATSATTAGSATSATSAITATSFSSPLAGDVTGPQSATVVSPNLPRLNGTNTFTGTNTFQGATLATNVNNVIVGAFTGNGIGLTNLDASQLISIGNTNGVNNNNCFVGPAGNSFTSGRQNTANGVIALGGITTGNNNTANGYAALSENGIGTNNTADGSQALAFNRSGNKNTALGYDALLQLGLSNGAGGTNNLALGNLAGSAFALNESGNIDIGNQGVPGDNNIIRLGDPSVQTTTFIAGVINGNGGGLTNLNAAQLSGSVPSGVSVPATNLTGVIPLASLPAAVVTNNNATSVNLNGTFTGNGSGLTSLAASHLTFVNTNNTFYGDQSLAAPTGDENTAFGYETLEYDSTGRANTAIGALALIENASGEFNTGCGAGALFYSVSGWENTAIGVETLYQLGESGYGAGGTNNIALGYMAGFAFGANESSNIDIGNMGVANENNTIRIGSSQSQTFIAGVINGNGSGLTSLSAANLTGALPAISGANLTSLPANAALLGASQSFTGNNTFTSTMTVTNSGAVNSLNVYGTQTGGWPNPVALFENKSTAATASPALRVVCDGGTNLDGALSVSVSTGSTGLIAEFGNSTAFVVRITNNGSIYAAGNVYANGVLLTSDRNAKELFKPVDNQAVLAKVAALPVTQWNYKQDQADVQHIGPMAQDFQAAFGLNGGDDKHISVVDEGGVALAAIQGLNQKLEAETKEKDAEIQTLKNQNYSLAERLKALEAAVKALAVNR